MSDDERDIRALLEAEAERAPRPQGLRRDTFRRGMGRRLGVVVLPLLVVASVAWVAVVSPFASQPRPEVVGPGPESADGLIAFVTQEPGERSLWIAVVPAGGGEATRLHEGRDPGWSPDGTRIVFGCDRGICTMEPDGSDVRELTDPEAPALDESPDWGPNGWIAFTRSYMDGKRKRDIVLVKENGGPQVTITNDDSDDYDPSWSPDGYRIAYVRGLADGLEVTEGELSTMDADGGTVVQLTDEGNYPARPDFSPDGRSILFDEASALWTIPFNGGEPTKLPVVSGRSSDVGSFPAWAPDSRRFAFSCDQGICLGDIDSEEETVLITNGGSPAWQPTATDGQVAEDQGIEWVTEVAKRAGFELIPTDGGATEIFREPSTFRMWAFPADQEDRRSTLRAEAYEPVGTVGGIELFSDGQRLTWEINGIYVWLSGVEGIDAETLGVADLVEASTELAWDGSLADDSDRKDQLTERVGQVACHDPKGDLLSEGSGDQSGPRPRSPEQQVDGTDLSGFSMSRGSDGTLELNWGTYGRIPDFLGDEAELSFVLTGSSKEPGYTFAAITATLKNNHWTVLIRNGDDEADYSLTPEVASEVLNLFIDPELVPRLMRGSFRWHAFSEWHPGADPVYNDYCPDSGFPKLEGHTT